MHGWRMERVGLLHRSYNYMFKESAKSYKIQQLSHIQSHRTYNKESSEDT